MGVLVACLDLLRGLNLRRLRWRKHRPLQGHCLARVCVHSADFGCCLSNHCETDASDWLRLLNRSLDPFCAVSDVLFLLVRFPV